MKYLIASQDGVERPLLFPGLLYVHSIVTALELTNVIASGEVRLRRGVIECRPTSEDEGFGCRGNKDAQVIAQHLSGRPLLAVENGA